MVGKEYEQGGIIKHGAKMINAVSNSTVPHLTVMMGASLRRRQLRHVRPRLRPAVPVHLAERRSRGDGPGSSSPACCRSSRGRRPRRAGRPYDEEADAQMRAMRRGSRSRSESLAPFLSGHALRRRHHRPARHPHRARHRAVGRRTTRAGRRAPSGFGVFRHVIDRRSRRVLVANRGEIARRVFRTCRDLGIATVAVYSDADADAPFVARGRRRRAAARQRAGRHLPARRPAHRRPRGAPGADAIHPGYGFLSENAASPRAVIDAGLTWVGPPPEAIDGDGHQDRGQAS